MTIFWEQNSREEFEAYAYARGDTPEARHEWMREHGAPGFE